MEYLVVLTRTGPEWERGVDMREQRGWDEHARFMDGLVDDGFILLGGPLEGEREVLHVVSAGSKEEIERRLAEDPWTPSGMLRTVSAVRRLLRRALLNTSERNFTQ